MNISKEFRDAKEGLSNIISQYLANDLSLIEFEELYSSQLDVYQEEFCYGGRYKYYDMGALVLETLLGLKSIYKEDEISRLKQELEELQEKDVNGIELPSYYSSKKLTSKQREKMCKNALFEIDQQMKHISIHDWIEKNFVIDDRRFEFFNNKGQSKLGSSVVLYKTPIVEHSFLLSALSGVIVKPNYSIEEILGAIEKVTKSQECFWVHCNDCDGVMAKIHVVQSWYAKDMESTSCVKSPYRDITQLSWFEEDLNRQHQANGDYNLLLLASDSSWLLKISYNLKEWWIELHGKEELLSEFSNSFKNTNPNK